MGKFHHLVRKKLESYVYLLIDPTNDEIFYVGKGKNNRVFDHLDDPKNTGKSKRIEQIRTFGEEPKIEILVHGLNDETALKVESAIIDLLGLSNLTNLQSGWQKKKYGRMSVDQVHQLYHRKKAIRITEPSLLISIRKSYKYKMTSLELYDATRSSWRVGVDNRNVEIVKYAFAVYDRVIQEVYEIKKWLDAGSTMTSRENIKTKRLREFVGKVAEEKIRNKYRFRVIEDYIKFPDSGIKRVN
jgi:hypothetical protein